MYTRRGDKGDTGLYGSKRVPKNDPRVEAYGTIDELNSYLGLVISESKDESVNSQLKEVQKLLFVAGADASAEPDAPEKVPRITGEDTLKIEEMTDALLKALPPLGNFILPGGTQVAANLQVARAVCRRAERKLVAASKKYQMNSELLPFFNRLSSYLFNLSRWVNLQAGVKEDVWKA